MSLDLWIRALILGSCGKSVTRFVDGPAPKLPGVRFGPEVCNMASKSSLLCIQNMRYNCMKTVSNVRIIKTKNSTFQDVRPRSLV